MTNFLNRDYFIDDFALKNSRNNNKFCFIIGSGASLESGIPNGEQLAKKWLKELYSKRKDIDYNCNYEEFVNNESLHSIKGLKFNNIAEFYSDIYSARFKNSEQEGIDEIIALTSNKKPSIGYIMLSQLLIQHPEYLVISTNFDNLLELSVSRFSNTYPRIINQENLSIHINQQIDVPTIIKMHHDAYFKPASIKEEIQKLKMAWKQPLNDVLKQYIPIVIGYGGNDKSLIDILSDFPKGYFKYGLYWMTYEDEIPNPKVQNCVVQHNGSFIRTLGFDALLTVIADKIEITKEKLIQKIENDAIQLSNDVEISLANIQKKLQDEKIKSQQTDLTGKQAHEQIKEIEEVEIALEKYSGRNANLKLLQASNYNDAINVFKKISHPDIYSYNILINKSENYEQALLHFTEMKASINEPDVTSYNTLINKSNEYEQALRHFNEIKATKIEPDITTYNTIINKSEIYEQALLHFNEIRATKIEPDITTYNTIINKSENFEQALLHFNEMKATNIEPNVRSYSTIINKSENYEQALLHFTEMKATNIEPNVISYNTIINKSENYEQALLHFAEMKAANIEPYVTSYNTLIKK